MTARSQFEDNLLFDYNNKSVEIEKAILDALLGDGIKIDKRKYVVIVDDSSTAHDTVIRIKPAQNWLYANIQE